jgi:hypothetical protein
MHNFTVQRCQRNTKSERLNSRNPLDISYVLFFCDIQQRKSSLTVRCK